MFHNTINNHTPQNFTQMWFTTLLRQAHSTNNKTHTVSKTFSFLIISYSKNSLSTKKHIPLINKSSTVLRPFSFLILVSCTLTRRNSRKSPPLRHTKKITSLPKHSFIFWPLSVSLPITFLALSADITQSVTVHTRLITTAAFVWFGSLSSTIPSSFSSTTINTGRLDKVVAVRLLLMNFRFRSAQRWRLINPTCENPMNVIVRRVVRATSLIKFDKGRSLPAFFPIIACQSITRINSFQESLFR